jgi:hypothetical protein
VLIARGLEPALQFVPVADLGLSQASDPVILEFAFVNGWLTVSHDTNTMRPAAETRIRNGEGIAGLFLVPQDRPARLVAENLVLIWTASQAEEWRDQIVYLPQ